MKSLKNVLAALAFVIGIGAAFATMGLNNKEVVLPPYTEMMGIVRK